MGTPDPQKADFYRKLWLDFGGTQEEYDANEVLMFGGRLVAMHKASDMVLDKNAEPANMNEQKELG
jgi:hypothetical protein